MSGSSPKGGNIRDLPALPPGYPLHLGEPQTVYRQGNVCRVRYAARFLVWLAVAVAYTLLFGLLFGRTSTGGAWVIGVIGLIFIAAGSFYVLRKEWRCVVQWQHVAVLFPDGFGYFDGERWRSFAWNEISEVTVWVKPPSWDWFSGGRSSFRLS